MLVTMSDVQVGKLFIAALLILLASDVSGQSFLTGDFFLLYHNYISFFRRHSRNVHVILYLGMIEVSRAHCKALC